MIIYIYIYILYTELKAGDLESSSVLHKLISFALHSGGSAQIRVANPDSSVFVVSGL